MSVRLIDLVLRTPLGTSQKMVLLVVADAASEEGVAWPRQSTISERASMTERSVRRILDDLRGLGLLSWRQRGLRRSNVYEIDVDRLREYAELGDSWTAEEPDRTETTGPASPDRSGESAPDRTSASAPDRTSASGPIRTVSGSERGPVTPARERARDLIFETLCRVSGIDWTAPMTKTERGRINRAAKELREIGATPDEILRVAAAYRLRWPSIDLTPQAVVGNWNLVRAPLPSDEASARVRRSMMRPAEMPGEATDGRAVPTSGRDPKQLPTASQAPERGRER